jgi:hypothetical protein
MHEGVDILESAIPTTDPAEVYAVIHKAMSSAIKVMRRRLQRHHRRCVPPLARPSPQGGGIGKGAPGKLVDWMIKFQFDGDVDYFGLDPDAYAPALRESGMATYLARLKEIEAGLGRGQVRTRAGRHPTRMSGSRSTGTPSG